jgi:hypothetical protein
VYKQECGSSATQRFRPLRVEACFDNHPRDVEHGNHCMLHAPGGLLKNKTVAVAADRDTHCK